MGLKQGKERASMKRHDDVDVFGFPVFFDARQSMDRTLVTLT